MKPEILTEEFFTTLEPLTEADSGNGAPRKMRVRGLMQREGVVNGNRREYPKGLLRREVARMQESISPAGF